MSERKYLVAEIDRMRRAISFGYSCDGSADIENRLRTYMLNGTSPEELEQMASENYAAALAALKSSTPSHQ